ncbi:hypothetical protein J8I87_13295 [Paraburkholderia sp. LEh10]|uniref:DUF6900 domain-containing protein n=1 Tax=Paraburkholderia sp. LEh10 TaxID=2821353 RepID=UPI001AE3F89E|nr:hypothetical protein [Paraburkholderia sp. LEh10]MBP0590675.1 hypothetical protein [Paraburkholderia sp. LEh10]
MVEQVRKEVHWEPLIAIASEELGIHSLTESGKATADIRLVRVSSVAKALERAYDFGLLMGHSVGRAEHPKTRRSELTSHAERDRVRAAAADILDSYWR